MISSAEASYECACTYFPTAAFSRRLGISLVYADDCEGEHLGVRQPQILPRRRTSLPYLPSSPSVPPPYIDLCLLGRQLGYRGGLKAIELQLGIQRRPDLWGLSGADGGQLWNQYRHRRDEEARERLVAYNEADCMNLQPLADLLYCRMVANCAGQGQ